MKKINITTLDHLDQIDQASFNQPKIIYKHSTTCGLCDIIWDIVKESDFELNYLDLLTYRPLSNEVERRYNVLHESPQILIIKDGKCVYNASHRKIKNEEIQKQLDQLVNL